LTENINAPIDPFSTLYWKKPTVAKTATMKPPQLAKQTSLPTNALTSFVSVVKSDTAPTSMPPPPLTTSKSESKAVKKPKAHIADEDMDEFKKAIDGSDLTKLGLIEILKKK